MPSFRGHKPLPVRLAIAAIAAACQAARAADNPAEAVEEQRVDVIGTTPLPGLGTALRDVPANVQVFTWLGGDQAPAPGQRHELPRGQPDQRHRQRGAGQRVPARTSSFRGFTASPLLGVPQGLSVFQDGVRINEPFGDVVNWDLPPQSAIASLQLIPGSNPIFGLNTLGGALSIYTKSGSTNPGTAVELLGRLVRPPHGHVRARRLCRQLGLVRHGQRLEGARLGRAQPGARRAAVRQGGLAGRRDRPRPVSFTGANNDLQGTQTLPRSFLGHPARGLHLARPGQGPCRDAGVEGQPLSCRRRCCWAATPMSAPTARSAFTSDVNDDYGSQDPDTGEIDTVQALNDKSTIDQTSYGLGLQVTFTTPWGGHANQFVGRRQRRLRAGGFHAASRRTPTSRGTAARRPSAISRPRPTRTPPTATSPCSWPTPSR